MPERMATVIGGPLDGSQREVIGAYLVVASATKVFFELGKWTDKWGYPEWKWMLNGDRYELIAEPINTNQ